jgi:hypothetical protein
MKYSTVLYLLVLFACGCKPIDVRTKLLDEQKILKDSANNINERIGRSMQKDVNDSAAAEKQQLGIIYTRLTAIQISIDSLDKMK